VTAGLFSLVFLGTMLSVHPIAAAVLLAVVGVAAAIWLARDAQRRRDALAARADYENRKWMQASVKWPPALSPEPPAPAA